MAIQQRNPFDIPVDGVSERHMTMDEIMQAFHACKTSEPEIARAMIEYACESGSLVAKYEYAVFLRTTPTLNMPQNERYQKAEELLVHLLNILDLRDSFTAKVALELGILYAENLHRPVGALAMYLRANRLGAEVEEAQANRVQRKVEKMDVNSLGGNARDSFNLGQELCIAGKTPRLAELFLREAVDKTEGNPKARNLYAQACLALGDFYDTHKYEATTYVAERDKLYAAARANGFPEYFTPDRAS